MAGCMHAPREVPQQGIVHMRHLLILGFALAVLAANSSAQDAQPRVKHFHDQTKSTKSGVAVGKTATSATPQANLRRLEQHATTLPTPHRVRRTPARASSLKAEKEKPTPPIHFSGSNAAKGPGTTNQGTNPYRGRLRQKGSHH